MHSIPKNHKVHKNCSITEVHGDFWRPFTQPFTELKKGHVEHVVQGQVQVALVFPRLEIPQPHQATNKMLRFTGQNA